MRVLILVVPIGLLALVLIIDMNNVLVLGLCIVIIYLFAYFFQLYPAFLIAGIYLTCGYNLILSRFNL